MGHTGGDHMELKHLLLLLGRLAVAALSAFSALSASANPIDTDNDSVLDDADDCPLSRGPAWNNGCPSNDWDVIVTGSPWAEIATCPDGSLAAGFWQCPTYDQGWGTFHVAVFPRRGHSATRLHWPTKTATACWTTTTSAGKRTEIQTFTGVSPRRIAWT